MNAQDSAETPQVIILTSALAVVALFAVLGSFYAEVEWVIPSVVVGTIGLQAWIYDRYGRPRR